MSLFSKAVDYAVMKFPALRECQKLAHALLREGAAAGKRRQVVMMPTGSGKTLLALFLIWQSMLKGKRCLFICDRNSLIEQTIDVCDRIGFVFGVVQARHSRMNLHENFQIASAQTLMRRGVSDDFDLVVVDEAHTLYKAIVDFIGSTRARVIGLTATPFTRGLGKIYDSLICPTTAHKLTEEGILVPLRIFSGRMINMKDAPTASGEWTAKGAGERGSEIVGDVLHEWRQNASDRKSIVFGATIRYCEELAETFNQAGIKAAVFCANTVPEDRLRILTEFRKPDSEIRILISVEALAKGFDLPDIACICDCRPLRKSLSTFIQMVGRGLRSSPETGKQDCLLLDFSGNITRFLSDYTDVFYNGLASLDDGIKLDSTVRKDKKKVSDCPKCGFSPCADKCLSCGYERKKKRATITSLPGYLQEITLNGRKMADSERHLYAQVCTHVRQYGNPDTARQRAYYLFRDIAGKAPGLSMDFESTPNCTISPNVRGKIKQLRIAFAKGQSSRQGVLL